MYNVVETLETFSEFVTALPGICSGSPLDKKGQWKKLIIDMKLKFIEHVEQTMAK